MPRSNPIDSSTFQPPLREKVSKPPDKAPEFKKLAAPGRQKALEQAAQELSSQRAVVWLRLEGLNLPRGGHRPFDLGIRLVIPQGECVTVNKAEQLRPPGVQAADDALSGALERVGGELEALEPAADVLPLLIDEAELAEDDSLLRPAAAMEHALENTLVDSHFEDCGGVPDVHSLELDQIG